MKHILLNEDNAEYAKFLVHALDDYQWTHVIKAEDAIEHVSSVDLIISDVDQPKSAGGMWLEKYARANRPELPFILMSGRLKDDPDVIGRDPRTPYFEKPFRLAELEKTIEDMLK